MNILMARHSPRSARFSAARRRRLIRAVVAERRGRNEATTNLSDGVAIRWRPPAVELSSEFGDLISTDIYFRQSAADSIKIIKLNQSGFGSVLLSGCGILLSIDLRHKIGVQCIRHMSFENDLLRTRRRCSGRLNPWSNLLMYQLLFLSLVGTASS